jgi:enoyl-CoA hydratase/carnithine racemase
MSLSAAYEFTSEVMTENSLADDAKEGITSFLEKRDPIWKDD